MEWWRNAKFGMFVHWGAYAGAEGQWNGVNYPDMRPGIEWLLCKGGAGPGGGGLPMDDYYKTLAPKMTLENFNPDKWAALAAEAGMQYFVITAKHHDGFGMVDFPGTDLDIAGRSPYGRDPMLPLSHAMREAGLRFGFYFSQSQDWSKPGGRPNWFKGLEGDWSSYVRKHGIPQLRHLLSGHYGAIDLLWFDSGSMSLTKEGAALIWAELAAQPKIIVNNRLSQGFSGDFETPEQWIPPLIQDDRDWETCMTMNGSWGYNPTDPQWKSSNELIRNLCAVVARGGNFLLNVGPRADGSWEPQVEQILHDIGVWMQINGVAIYGTEANPIGTQRWGELTRKRDGDTVKLYALITNWPKSGTILLPLANDPRAITWLGVSDSAPGFRREADGLRLMLNRDAPIHSAVSVLELTLGAEPSPLPQVIQPNANSTVEFISGAARVVGGVPMLRGWSGKRANEAAAYWNFRTYDSTNYKVEIEYGYNHPDPDVVANQAYLVHIGNQVIELPLRLSGIETDAYNKGRRVLLVDTLIANEVLALPEGLHELAVTARGTPIDEYIFKGPEIKQFCYDNFAYLKAVRLVPVDE
jgi:alpha-L-fucosidase